MYFTVCVVSTSQQSGMEKKKKTVTVICALFPNNGPLYIIHMGGKRRRVIGRYSRKGRGGGVYVFSVAACHINYMGGQKKGGGAGGGDDYISFYILFLLCHASGMGPGRLYVCMFVIERSNGIGHVVVMMCLLAYCTYSESAKRKLQQKNA